MLPPSQTISIMQSNVASPIDSPKNAEQNMQQEDDQKIKASDLQRVEVLSRQTNERPKKIQKKEKKLPISSVAIEYKTTYSQLNSLAAAIKLKRQNRELSTHTPMICGITKIKVKNSPKRVRKNEQDPWKLHHTLQTRSVVGRQAQASSSYDQIMHSKVRQSPIHQNNTKPLEGLNF